MNIATICLLAFKRPDFLRATYRSLRNVKGGYPYELIIHEDGSSDEAVRQILDEVRLQAGASYLIENLGRNRGIEKAMKSCIGVSSGKYIFKVDTDLTFKINWVREAVEILEEDKEIGCVSLLDYRNYAPEDKRFHKMKDMGRYYLSDNFVSSCYAFRRSTFDEHGAEMGNDGWHKVLHKKGYKLAITKPDYVENYGFGHPNTIWVKKDGTRTDIFDEPKIYEGGEQ